MKGFVLLLERWDMKVFCWRCFSFSCWVGCCMCMIFLVFVLVFFEVEFLLRGC